MQAFKALAVNITAYCIMSL